MNNPPQIGMDQLSYFVSMVRGYLDPDLDEYFWSAIRKNCPDLMQAIESHFLEEMRTITFTRDLISPAFETNTVFGGDE